MGNRSDRRFANLANPLALEAVVPIRTRRADSIMARANYRAPHRGRIYECNRLHLNRSSGLRPGLGPYTRVRIHFPPPTSLRFEAFSGDLRKLRACSGDVDDSSAPENAQMMRCWASFQFSLCGR